MFELAVIGGSEFVLGFQLAGIKHAFETEEAQAPRKIFSEVMKNEKIGIIITDDKTIGKLDEHIREDIETSVKPVVVVLSAEPGAEETLKKMIKKSIGVSLWQE